jgi:hypothetical protein
LQIHTRLKPSVVADALGRLVLLAASGALVASFLVAGDAGWVGGLAALALFSGMVFFIARRPVKAPSHIALSVDAGGNWAVADAEGWHRFTPHTISRSALGWITLQGVSQPVQTSGANRAAMPVACQVVIWFDNVPLPVWRRVNVAATWLMQRQQGLQMHASAADPRLGSAP